MLVTVNFYINHFFINMDDDDDNNYNYNHVIVSRCLRPCRELRKQCFATNSRPDEIPGQVTKNTKV